jgi:hypothetical protein
MTAVRDAILRLVGQSRPVQVHACQVKAVDQTNYTCQVTPADGSPDFYNVRLRSSVDESQEGVLIVPAINSWVLVGCIGDNDSYRFVMLYGEIDHINIVCDDIRLNGNQFGGLVKVQEMYDAINRLEQKLSNHQHIYIDGPGTGQQFTLKSTNPTQDQTISPNTTLQSLKNDTVKHG